VALDVRAGLRNRADDDFASAFALGGGITASHVTIDYAYQPLSGIGSSTQRIGIRWRQ
jgi:hypothetical protein